MRRPTPYLQVEVRLLCNPDNPNKITTVFAAGVKVGATFACERVHECDHVDVCEGLRTHSLAFWYCVSVGVVYTMHTTDIYALYVFSRACFFGLHERRKIERQS